jgi:hypothetical protein
LRAIYSFHYASMVTQEEIEEAKRNWFSITKVNEDGEEDGEEEEIDLDEYNEEEELENEEDVNEEEIEEEMEEGED